MSIQHTILSGKSAYQHCRAELAHFATDSSPMEEWMLQLHVTENAGNFSQQLNSLLAAYCQFLMDTPQAQVVMTRVFLSDAANQEVIARAELPADCGALSIIEQPPLDGTRVAMLIYFQSEIEREFAEDGMLICKQGAYQHLWAASARKFEGDAHTQCRTLFEEYSQQLESRGGSLFNDSIRTWLFVQNVDVNYAGVVTGRNEHFDVKGLTSDTHFISSTGIQGRSAEYSSVVQLDSYSVLGLKPEQIQFLYAPEFLNPTHEYGVRFERGTALHFEDRTFCTISGTASIDNLGEVVHVGDIKAQCLRMWENVEALLAEASASMSDMMQIIIYLRDMSDYELIACLFEEKFPKVPKQIVLAPVCRPTWLIEMECITLHSK